MRRAGGGEGVAGRREVPVDPAAGPVQRFAFELRKLRAEADGITYRSLAQRAGYSVTTLAQAAGGERLPTLPVALAYARACGADPAEWEARWKAAVEESAAGGTRDDAGCTRRIGVWHGSRPGTAVCSSAGNSSPPTWSSCCAAGGSPRSSALPAAGSPPPRAGLIPVLQHAPGPGLRPAAIRILTPGERPARSHAPLLTPATPRDGRRGGHVRDRRPVRGGLHPLPRRGRARPLHRRC